MSLFGTREDDPLLQNDPLAPSSEGDSKEEQQGEPSSDTPTEDASTESVPADKEAVSPNGDGKEESPFSNSEEPESVFGAGSSTETEAENQNEAESDVSRADLLGLLIENRAAMDVLFEMMAYDRADGQEEGYRQFLNALHDRHEVVLEKYRSALDADLPDFWNEEKPTVPGDERADPHEQSWI